MNALQCWQIVEVDMSSWMLKASLLLLMLSSVSQGQSALQPSVHMARVPDAGMQARMVNDNAGGVHLIYFKPANAGKRAGHLFYSTYVTDKDEWSTPVRVSSSAYGHQDAIAKANLTIDDVGRAHVVWLRGDPVEYMYARSNPDRSNFEPERSLIKENLEGVEAEASIASFGDTVTLTWHAGDLGRESERSVFALTSRDGGQTFGEETRFSDPALGACACCTLASTYARDGELTVAYRSAINGDGRHMQLLVAPPTASSTAPVSRLISEWFLAACPVSSANFSQRFPSNHEVQRWLAFEREGEIFFVDVDREEAGAHKVTAGKSKVRQKHPSIAVNGSGQRLIVWGEGFGFRNGGDLKMRMFDRSNRPLVTPDTKAMRISNFSVAAVAALADGSFLVLY